MDLWRGNKRLFIIARSPEIAALSQRDSTFHYLLLAENHGNVLITNANAIDWVAPA
jgi:hypothetical protein